MITAIRTFLNDDSGATTIEYGFIAALVSVAAIAAIDAMGDSLPTVFNTAAGEIADVDQGDQATTISDQTTTSGDRVTGDNFSGQSY